MHFKFQSGKKGGAKKIQFKKRLIGAKRLGRIEPSNQLRIITSFTTENYNIESMIY